ncbi:putative FBD domain-containing protein [Rosa chinensis]|uniref:Putative FBD domain-containing protein n=1 Tax=Rosa chinensis TaxID=74649 RepID=A0A2P6P5M0_ROSCH|nr:putative FBD domain-containing protein [Rosa chinensis]
MSVSKAYHLILLRMQNPQVTAKFFFNYEDVDCASRLLGGVSCVQYLSLEAPNFLECHLPTFNHLKQLKLLVFYSSDWEEYVTELTAFLKRSPRLEHLVLEIGLIGSKCEGHKEPFNPPESVPSCLLSHLKTISISVQGYENQLQVVKYLLKFSEVLTTMTISLTSSHCKAKQELYEEILTFQKGSKTCELEFV